jgi:hypothetical protein
MGAAFFRRPASRWQFTQLSELPEKPLAFSGVRRKMASPR